MIAEFYSAHLDTLCELKALAEKHNCKISFGTRNDFSTEELSSSDLFAVGVPSKIIDRLINPYEYHFSIENVKISYDELWFQLYDPNNENRKYHVMAYKEIGVYFELEKDWDFDCDTKGNEKFIEWCEENQVDWNDDDDKFIFNLTDSPTIINGFGYKKEKKDYRVYREGMALHYFTELVCKYLKEPMIERTY